MTDQQDMNQFMDEIDKSMTKLEKGAILKGTVMTVGEEDVIVNIGHMSDGIITKNELTSESGKEPSQIVSEGDEIDVYVLKADDGEGNVVLSKNVQTKLWFGTNWLKHLKMEKQWTLQLKKL